jgi:NADH-quinone oxidoreductase subunit H
MRFGMFFLAEYANVATASIIMVVLFFGGWQLPLIEFSGFADGSIVVAIFQIGITLAKIIVLVFVIIWIRWSMPRFRYDQLMRLGWHILLHLALLNLVVTAFIIYFN